jgi:hypothetical protein
MQLYPLALLETHKGFLVHLVSYTYSYLPIVTQMLSPALVYFFLEKILVNQEPGRST